MRSEHSGPTMWADSVPSPRRSPLPEVRQALSCQGHGRNGPADGWSCVSSAVRRTESWGGGLVVNDETRRRMNREIRLPSLRIAPWAQNSAQASQVPPSHPSVPIPRPNGRWRWRWRCLPALAAVLLETKGRGDWESFRAAIYDATKTSSSFSPSCNVEAC